MCLCSMHNLKNVYVWMHEFSVTSSAHFSRAAWLLSLHPSVYLLFFPSHQWDTDLLRGSMNTVSLLILFYLIKKKWMWNYSKSTG